MDYQSRGVAEFVLCVDYEKRFNCLDHPRVRSEFVLVLAVEHEEQVLDVGERGVGRVAGLALRVRVDEGHERGQKSEYLHVLVVPEDGVSVDCLPVDAGVGFGHEGRECVERRDEHAHGMCTAAEGVHQSLYALVHDGTTRDAG